ncbi:SsgA family sporulation/cell division regulator [Streptomyces sp. NPDC041068]|uniref:SsgA family sporulation/cell division regulator n=1 Tax=Streptomyces sp. NPDC041068 TaxID=3155130 RepID=UPI0033F5B6DD
MATTEWTQDDRYQIATDSMIGGLALFHKYGLVQGKWSPDGGASLSTYFVGATLRAFRPAYMSWFRSRQAGQAELAHPGQGESGEPHREIPDQRAGDPCYLASMNDEIKTILPYITDPQVREGLGWRAMGYTQAEAAERVGLTAKALERRISRIRIRLVADLVRQPELGEGGSTMTVRKDDTMDNGTTTGEHDDFDALLDASSLGAPHVLAECTPIPAAVNHRMRSARTHLAQTPLLHAGVEQGDGTSKAASEPLHSQDDRADRPDRGTVLSFSAGSGKTHTYLAGLMRAQPRMRVALWLNTQQAPEGEELWSDYEELWSLMRHSTASQWAPLTAERMSWRARRPASTVYAGRARRPMTPAERTARRWATLLADRLGAYDDALWRPERSRSVCPPQVTRWSSVLEELIGNSCDATAEAQSQAERTLRLLLCPHEHQKTPDGLTRQPPPYPSDTADAHFAAAHRHQAWLDFLTRLLAAGMPPGARQELDLPGLPPWIFPGRAEGAMSWPARTSGNSSRTDLAAFLAHLVNHRQLSLPWADMQSSLLPITRPAPLALGRPRNSVTAARTLVAPVPSRRAAVHTRKETEDGATLLHADLPMAWHADETRPGSSPVPATFTYRSNDPFAITAVFYPQEPEETVWTFARDLLAEGIHHSTGEGDVIVWSSRSPTTHTTERHTFIRLRSPEGTALLSLKTSHLAAYLEQTQRLVPSGTEHQHLRSTISDFEEELGQCVRLGPGC